MIPRSRRLVTSLLEQPVSVSEQFCQPDSTRNARVNVWHVFQARPNGAGITFRGRYYQEVISTGHHEIRTWISWSERYRSKPVKNCHPLIVSYA